MGLPVILDFLSLICQIVIAVYAMMQTALLVQYLFTINRKKHTQKLPDIKPSVLVQLPIYNEGKIVDDLLNNIIALDYPSECLKIQILDDSTDDTTQLIKKWLSNYNGKFVLHHIIRANRTGYKAGALAHGLQTDQSEYVVIFDADFLPKSDFLVEILPHFYSEKVGVVQSKWTYNNVDENILTSLQRIQLDAHFSFEQAGRSNNNLYCQFNGTAGVWRRACINDAGGWKGDCLTEDLDLSIISQLKGWKINYISSIDVECQLPSNTKSIKNQQFRWVKGSVQVCLKHFLDVWKANISLKTKIFTSHQLLVGFVYIFVCTIVWIEFVKNILFQDYLWKCNIGISGLFIPMIFFIQFYYPTVEDALRYKKKSQIFGNRMAKFVLEYVFLLCVSIYISIQNSVAAWEAIFNVKSDFVRTEKKSKHHISNLQIKPANQSNYVLVIEYILLGLSFFCVFFSYYNMDIAQSIMPIMYIIGFGIMNIR